MAYDNTFFVNLDTNANIVEFDGIAPSVSGYAPSEVIGKNWFEVFIPERNLEEMTLVFNGLLHGDLSNWEYENEITCKDGSKCLIKWKNTLRRDNNNNLSGITSHGVVVH